MVVEDFLLRKSRMLSMHHDCSISGLFGTLLERPHFAGVRLLKLSVELYMLTAPEHIKDRFPKAAERIRHGLVGLLMLAFT